MKKNKEQEEQQPIENSLEGQEKINIVEEANGDEKISPEEMSIEEKLSVANDKYVRLVAEFDNFRKRTAKERLELIMSAGEGTISGLLPVLDDFERALHSMQATISEAERQGIQLIYDKLFGYLQSKGLQRIEAIGVELDTDRHEAVAKIPAPMPEQKGKVVDEVEPGYTLNGKIVRYAKVVVGE